MKVKVTTEFRDKHTGELHEAGDILDLHIQRINEILTAGSFIELVEQSEPEKEQAERAGTAEPSPEVQKEDEDAGEQAEGTRKQAGGRKRR